MIEIPASQIESLVLNFLTANTAPSFQRWLEKQWFVLRLAKDKTFDLLLESLHESTETGLETFEEIAKAYMFLVAIILHCRNVGRKIEIPFSLDGLDWADKMLSLSKHNIVATSLVSITPIITSQIVTPNQVSESYGKLVNLSNVPYKNIDN